MQLHMANPFNRHLLRITRSELYRIEDAQSTNGVGNPMLFGWAVGNPVLFVSHWLRPFFSLTLQQKKGTYLKEGHRQGFL